MADNTLDKPYYPASKESTEVALAVSITEQLSALGHEPTDDRLIDLWTHGRSLHTDRAYRADARRLLCFTSKPLAQTRLDDLQQFADALEGHGLSPAAIRRVLSSVKSLFAFAHRLGYLPFDTAKPLRLPGLRDTLNERILDESQVHRMLALEVHPRNHVLLLLLYASGVRVSEVCGLRWGDCKQRDGGGQITVFGKGAKTRTILLPSSVFQRLVDLRNGATEEQPVFLSRRNRALSPSQVLRIVKRAAIRAGIERNVVVHTMRHCHASHALDRGAPISLVQTTLGHSGISTTGRYLHARPSDSSARFLPL